MLASPISINHSPDNNHSGNNSYEDDDDCSCTHQDQHQLFSLENTRKGWYLTKRRQFLKNEAKTDRAQWIKPTDRCVKVCDWRCGLCRRSRTRFNTTGFDCLLYELRTEPPLTPITGYLAVPKKENRVRFACGHKGGVSFCFMRAITLLSEAHPPLHSNRAHRFYLQCLAVSHTLRCSHGDSNQSRCSKGEKGVLVRPQHAFLFLNSHTVLCKSPYLYFAIKWVQQVIKTCAKTRENVVYKKKRTQLYWVWLRMQLKCFNFVLILLSIMCRHSIPWVSCLFCAWVIPTFSRQSSIMFYTLYTGLSWLLAAKRSSWSSAFSSLARKTLRSHLPLLHSDLKVTAIN